MKDFKSGFTLSEVLITLGIVGVIAALMGIAIFTVKPDPSIVMLKKASDVFSKTVADLVADEMYYPSTPKVKTIDNTVDVAPGLSSSFGSGGSLVPVNTDKFCYLFSKKVGTTGVVDCSYTGTPRLGSFTTKDGITWKMSLPTAFPRSMKLNAYQKVYVDVNGDDAPNCIEAGAYTGTTCAAGVLPDQYVFMVRYDGKVLSSKMAQVILSNPTKNTKDIMSLYASAEDDTDEQELQAPSAPAGPCGVGAVTIGGFCVAATDMPYNKISLYPYTNNDNYWAGAKKACNDAGMRLPTFDEFYTMYDNRALLGFTANKYYWAQGYNASDAGAGVLSDGSGFNYYEKNHNDFKVRCVGDGAPETVTIGALKVGTQVFDQGTYDTYGTFSYSSDGSNPSPDYLQGGQKLCESEGMRLPTMAELQTIWTNKAVFDPYGGINPALYFMSSDAFTSGGAAGWVWCKRIGGDGNENAFGRDGGGNVSCVK